MGEWIDLQASDGVVLPAWAARTQGRVRAAVVVLPEMFGLNQHIRCVVGRFAARGFLCVVPDLFSRIQPGAALDTFGPDDVQRARGLCTLAEAQPAPGVMGDVLAAVQWAAGQTGAARRVGIVGFGWGGLLAWRAAQQVPQLSAAVCYYGDRMGDAAELREVPLCPVQAHFAQRGVQEKFMQALAFNRAQPGVEMYIYDAPHGFNCELRRKDYDDHSATQAKNRTLAFLDRHLQVF